MRKIPTIFLRPERAGKGHLFVTRDPHPDCAWVFNGEGIATEKLDGTNVRLTVRSGTVVRVEKRRNPTKEQKALGIVEPWYVDADAKDSGDKWIFEAVSGTDTLLSVREDEHGQKDWWPDGEHCCEALGPNIQGNPLGLTKHECVPFDIPGVIPVYEITPDGSDPYDGIKGALANLDSLYSPGHLAEGIVFHHPDGRRAKIKRKDFGP